MNSITKLGLYLVLGLIGFAPYAVGAPVQAEGPGAMTQLVFFGGFILIFYFLMWRPQSKRAKEHRNLVAELSKGDEIITNGGIAGKIAKVSDDFISVEIAEGVEVKLQKAAVTTALPKGTLKGI